MDACAILFAVSIIGGDAGEIPAMPIPVPRDRMITARWLAKPILASRTLDSMEDLARWSHDGFGRMDLTKERAKDGEASLRLTSPTCSGKPSPGGRPFGAATVRRRFDGEDWREFNRISFWVYPTLPGFRVISMGAALHSEGERKSPGPYGREGRSFFLLEPERWNPIVWEIPHLGRDKVTGIEFTYRLQGNEPGAAGEVCFDFDVLALERVEADPDEGWDVPPARIAYSHSGYLPWAWKTAIAGAGAADSFRIIDEATGAAVLSGAVEVVRRPIGIFKLIDFSSLRAPGMCRIEAGPAKTPPFRIGAGAWRGTIVKTVNFFYAERCGFAVPGIHDICHRDWQSKHGEQRIIIDGGWHDAGDLSQGCVNTAEATAALFRMAAQVGDGDPALARRLTEEASWGLAWLLSTRFGDGFRSTWATMDFWTDGIIGTTDDVVAEASDSAFENLTAAGAEAVAARALRAADPNRARFALRAAEEDWRFAMARLDDSPRLELAAGAATAALDLFEATGDAAYADAAIAHARTILDCQEHRILPLEIPLSGFFYTDPRRDRILHYSHRSHEQAPIVALARLCALFPGQADWMAWYAGVARYSEYLRAASRVTEPYGMLPASLYRAGETTEPDMREQILQGMPMGEGLVLRIFPVWYNGFRGNNGTLLAQAKALAAAARLRGDADLARLAHRQLEWVAGRNPFVQSLMTGEGHDFAPQYTAMSGDIVGSLPVGIQTYRERDLPHWPANTCYNFKEVWVHPSSRWLDVLCDLSAFTERGPGPVAIVLSQETGTDGGVRIRVAAEGAGRVRLAIRAHNLEVGEPSVELSLEAGKSATFEWKGRMERLDEAWVAVVAPDGDGARRQEVSGAVPRGR